MEDPRVLIQVLIDQGWIHEGNNKDEYGTPIYVMAAPDGRRCFLLWADFKLLHDRGKLNLAGVDELDAEKKKKTGERQ